MFSLDTKKYMKKPEKAACHQSGGSMMWLFAGLELLIPSPILITKKLVWSTKNGKHAVSVTTI